MSDEFDWFEDDSVVVKGQPAIAVYTNRLNNVVIRQDSGGSPEDDAAITIAPAYARLVADALLREASANVVSQDTATGNVRQIGQQLLPLAGGGQQ